MTTRFNSFDQSQAGAFVESPHGARNRPEEEAKDIWLSLYWLNESQGPLSYVAAGGGPTEHFESDVAAWNARVVELANQDIRLMLLAYHIQTRDGSWQPILPIAPGPLWTRTRLISWQSVVLSDWTAMYEAFVRSPGRVKKVLATIDLSLSMSDWWFSFRLAWNDFGEQLAARFPEVRRLVNTGIGAERWIGNSIQ